MTTQGQPGITVQCDFDNTIVTENIGHMVLEAFVPESWRVLDEAYQRGEMSVERNNQIQWGLVRARRESIQELVVDRVQVREGFLEFVGYCHREGVRLVVVSNGLDLYIEPVLDLLGVPDLEHYCGKTVITTEGVEVRYTDPLGMEWEEGFKVACLRYLRGNDERLVYIGDGISDITPALQSDYVIARDTLADHLQSQHRPYFSFETFYEVICALGKFNIHCHEPSQ